jgi:hypothetical protein
MCDCRYNPSPRLEDRGVSRPLLDLNLLRKQLYGDARELEAVTRLLSQNRAGGGGALQHEARETGAESQVNNVLSKETRPLLLGPGINRAIHASAY